MSVPSRVRLVDYLVEAFEPAELKSLVRTFFAEAVARLPWQDGLETQADDFVRWLERRDLIPELWPALKELRPRHSGKIEELMASWGRSQRSDGELQDWLQRYAAGLIQLSEQARASSTWLDDPELADISVRGRSIGETGTGRLVRTLERSLQTVEPRVVLVGDGGAGKTTLLIRIAVAMAREALEDERALLPLYVQLNYFYFNPEERAPLDALLDVLERETGLPEPVLRAIRRGARPCCFLLDGLNEVNSEFMNGCFSAIKQLAPKTGRHRCIVTSRPTADVDDLVRQINPATILETVPLTESQISAVLDRRGLAGVAARLGPRLADLARTPYLLSAIVKSREALASGPVPLSVPQLIQRLIDDYIFHQREPQKPKDVRPTTYDYDVKRPILARLALEMVRKGVTRIPEDMALLNTIHAELQELGTRFHGRREVMPREPNATKFLDEVVLNDIVKRKGETLEFKTLEFKNESVLNYYAGVGIESSSLTAVDIAALVPPLVWRRIDVGTDELPIPGAVTEAIAMYMGLDARASELLPLVAERHLLAAARCMWTAGLHEAPAGRALLRTWTTLLGDPWPAHRWVACQCLLHAGNIDENAGQRLADLAHSDPDPFVRLVAMHALSRCACIRPIASLVGVLVAYDVEQEDRGIDPGIHLWRLHSPQAVRALVERWSESTTSDRDRARIESLLATMDPDFVDDTLARIGGPAADRARRALPGWNYLGVQTSRRLREQDKVDAASKEARRQHRDRLAAEPAEELQRLLNTGRDDERDIVLELLCDRRALTVDSIFDMLRDPSPGVRARAEAALLELPPDQWRAVWDERMGDAKWTVLFHVPAVLEQELFFELSESVRWVQEFASRGISARELGCEQDGPEWLLKPVGVGGSLEKDVYRVIREGDRLAVIGVSIRPRLAVLGARLGDSAMPTLDRFLGEDPRNARTAVLEAWGRIGTDSAIERLAEHLRSEPLDSKVVASIAASRHPTAKALLLDVLRAMAGLGVDVENRVTELTRFLLDLGAADELRRLSGTMLDSPDAGTHIVATHVLACLAEPPALSPSTMKISTFEESRSWQSTSLSGAAHSQTERPFEDLAMRACGDPDPRVRVVGMKLLASTQDAAGRELLLQACVNEPAHEVWSAACAVFRRACSDDDLLRLRKARDAPDRDTRSRVIGTLARVHDPTVIQDLHDALKDPDAEIRVLAAEGLQQFGVQPPSPQRDPSPGDR